MAGSSNHFPPTDPSRQSRGSRRRGAPAQCKRDGEYPRRPAGPFSKMTFNTHPPLSSRRANSLCYRGKRISIQPPARVFYPILDPANPVDLDAHASRFSGTAGSIRSHPRGGLPVAMMSPARRCSLPTALDNRSTGPACRGYWRNAASPRWTNPLTVSSRATRLRPGDDPGAMGQTHRGSFLEPLPMPLCSPWRSHH